MNSWASESTRSRPLVAEYRPVTTAIHPPMISFSPYSDSLAISRGVKSSVLRALIVDDEPVARRVLREEIELQPDIEVVGEADSGLTALEEIGSLLPDLVFLDLQMPEMGGFEVVQQLRRGSHLPVIIVVTAYDQYAILCRFSVKWRGGVLR